MRVFIAVLILTFSFQIWTIADDIRDFEIEGMSVGDSLLEFYDEEKIKRSVVPGIYTHIKKNPGKFYQVEINIEGDNFTDLIIVLKKNDPKYKIYMLKGAIVFDDNIESCYKKQKEINNILEKMFSNLKKEEFTKAFDHDPDSKVKSITYWFDFGGYVDVDCYDWSVDSGYIDHLRSGINTKEFNEWLNEL